MCVKIGSNISFQSLWTLELTSFWIYEALICVFSEVPQKESHKIHFASLPFGFCIYEKHSLEMRKCMIKMSLNMTEVPIFLAIQISCSVNGKLLKGAKNKDFVNLSCFCLFKDFFQIFCLKAFLFVVYFLDSMFYVTKKLVFSHNFSVHHCCF